MAHRTVLITSAAVLALVGGYVAFGPTQITARAFLGEGGPEITDLLRWDAEEVLDTGGEGVFSVSLVDDFDPTTQAGNQFRVPPWRTIELEPSMVGWRDAGRDIQTGGWPFQTHDFIIEGTLAEVTFLGEWNDAMVYQIQGQMPDGTYRGFGGGVPEAGVAHVILPDGTWTIHTQNGPIDVQQQVQVTSGEVIDVTLDMRAASVTIAMGNAGEWAEGVPRIETHFTPVNGGNRITFEQSSRVSANRALPFGEYELRVNAQPTGRTGAEVTWSGPVSVTPETQTISIPLAYWIVDADVTGAEDLIPTANDRIDLRVIETSYRGYEMGATVLTGGQPETPILFTHDPEFDPLNYALAIVDAGGVQAIAPFPTPESGTITRVAITVGEGQELCMPLFESESFCAFTATTSN